MRWVFLLVVVIAAFVLWPLWGRSGISEPVGDVAPPRTTTSITAPPSTTTQPPTTTVPVTTTTARTAPIKAASVSRPVVSAVAPSERWLALADCESGDGDGRPPYSMTDNYRGLHHGALQWHPDTWARARRMSGLPVAESAADAPFADEVAVAKVWLRATSPRQWPVCGPRVGLTMEDAA